MSYTKTNWVNDMVIEANALNNIEEGIFNIEEKVDGFDSLIQTNDVIAGSGQFNTVTSDVGKFRTLEATQSLEASGGLSLLDDENGSATFKFKSNDGTITYGSMEKHLDGTSNDVYFKSTDGIIYFQPNKANGYNKVNFGTSTGGYEAYLGTGSTWRFAPYGTSTTAHLGHNSTAGRWAACYLKAAANVSSDKNLKENIIYLNDKEVVKRESVITTDDMYSFVKDELRLTKYNLKEQYVGVEHTKDILGFIAQDVAENDKVKNILITEDEEGMLGYDTGAYTNILAGALQVALNKIETLENKLVELEARL